MWGRRRFKKANVNKIDKQTAAEENKDTSEVENTFKSEVGEKKDPTKGSESKEEESELADTNLENTDDALERQEELDEKEEEAVEKDEKAAEKQIHLEDVQDSGGKLKRELKKEDKEKEKVVSDEAKGVEDEKLEETELMKELQAALRVMASTELISKDVAAAAKMRGQHEAISTHLSANVLNYAGILSRYQNYNQLNSKTIDWIKQYFLPAIFRDFEEKLRIEHYSQIVDDGLMRRLSAARRVAVKSINRLEKHQSRLDKFQVHDFKDQKDSISELNKFIKTKIKERNRVKKKAKKAKEQQIVVQLSKEIDIYTGHRDRLVAVSKEIDRIRKVTAKNEKRANKVLKLLDNNSDHIVHIEHHMENIHEETLKKISSVSDDVRKTKERIESYFRNNKEAEEIAVETNDEVKRFFNDYETVLNFLLKFSEDIKAAMTLCINMAFNERALYYLLDSMERLQSAAREASTNIILMSEAIIQAKSASIPHINYFLQQLETSENRMKKLSSLTQNLEKVAENVARQSEAARTLVQKEIDQLESIKADARKEEEVILDKVRLLIQKKRERVEKIDAEKLQRTADITKHLEMNRESSEQRGKQATRLAA